jgi:hypothetical protein
MGGYDVPQTTAAASAKDAAVQVRLNFAVSGLKLWSRPMVVTMTPDDAMALSIELQKAAIAARQCEYHRTASAVHGGRLPNEL